MDRFHTKICKALFNHLKDELTPPISSEKERKELEDNVENLVLNSNLHVFDDGDTIWKKLSSNKDNFPYFNSIYFLQDINSSKE